MDASAIADPLFLQAVKAIDYGNIPELEDLIVNHPRLVTDRLPTNGEGYFKDPYLVWFVADNPIRIETLPANIVHVTDLLVRAVKRKAPDTSQQQIDYTLGLVTTARIPRECGVQIAMMDLLIDAGAAPIGVIGALANGNVDAARHLINRGAELTLGAAVCLELEDDIDLLATGATTDDKLTALTAAAFYGKTAMVKRLLATGIDPNGYPAADSGFHSHGTPLHQAVSSGSLDTVKLLVEAGAKLNAPDNIYDGTPLDWADYMQRDEHDEAAKRNFASIEDYLREAEGTDHAPIGS
jgi:peptide-methionine (S)-S-oxide reductase